MNHDLSDARAKHVVKKAGLGDVKVQNQCRFKPARFLSKKGSFDERVRGIARPRLV